MKISRRLTALLVTLVFALSSFMSISAFAAESVFPDVAETHPNYEAITELVSEGIVNGYEDGTFKPDNTITRAEFAKLLAVSSAPAGTQFTATTTKFYDVADSASASAWAIPYISYAVGTGAINGYEDGTFRPSNTVTYGETIKMIVCTLGYGPVVDTGLVPWYQGYVDVANQIKLTNNAVAMGDAPANRALVAQLIYNMLGTAPLVQVGVNPDGTPNYQQGGITGGNSSFGDNIGNTENSEGVLMGVFDFCLTGDSDVTKSKVLIDDTIYNIGELDRETLKDLVGYRVKYYYTTTGKETLTKVSKLSGGTEVTEIEDWQIAELTKDYIKYYKDEDDEYDDKTTKLSFNEDFYVVYNGVPVDPDDIDDDFITSYLDVVNGSIKFLSNDSNDKNVEVVFVESYTTYFVGSVSTSNGVTTVYDKHPAITGLSSLALDEHDEITVKKLASKTGSLTDSTIKSITKNSILDIALPFDTVEGANAVVSTATITGTVKSLSSDYEEIVIDNDTYRLSPYYEMILEGGADVDFALNDSGKFYLDYKGRITFFEKTESTNPYGLVIRYKKTSGMDSSYAIEVLTSTSSTTVYELKEKLRVNGTTMTAEEAIDYLIGSCSTTAQTLYEASPKLDDDDNPIPFEDVYGNYIIQPVKYKTSVSNSKTYISEIECMNPDDIENGAVSPYPINNSKYTGTKEYFADGGKLTYSKTGYTFKHGSANQFAMSSSGTVVYQIPMDISDISKYRKTNTGTFSNGNTYCVEAYNVEKSSADAVLYYVSSSTADVPYISGATSVYFINRISDAYDSYGQPVKKISYIKAGDTEEKETLTDYDANSDFYDKLADIESGDLVKFGTSGTSFGSIKTVYVDGTLTSETGSYQNGNTNFISSSYEGTDDYYQVIKGTVYTIDEDDKTLRVIPAFIGDDDFDEDSWESFTLGSSVAYYKYNTKAEKFEVTAIGEILTYEEFAQADPEDASKVVAIVKNKAVVAVYILAD